MVKVSEKNEFLTIGKLEGRLVRELEGELKGNLPKIKRGSLVFHFDYDHGSLPRYLLPERKSRGIIFPFEGGLYVLFADFMLMGSYNEAFGQGCGDDGQMEEFRIDCGVSWGGNGVRDLAALLQHFCNEFEIPASQLNITSILACPHFKDLQDGIDDYCTFMDQGRIDFDKLLRQGGKITEPGFQIEFTLPEEDATSEGEPTETASGESAVPVQEGPKASDGPMDEPKKREKRAAAPCVTGHHPKDLPLTKMTRK
jgi:hypothetical protein